MCATVAKFLPPLRPKTIGISATDRATGRCGFAVPLFRWIGFEAKPVLGCTFTAEEDRPNASHEVVLSYATWKNVFGADASVVGRSIQLNQEPYQVVGVMGAGLPVA
jgi:hypothetical protein